MTRLFPTWRGRRRWTVLALCAVLAALPVADRVAAGVAEGRIADRVAAVSTAVVGTPQVRIDGFPFLLDVARGTFPQVSVRADAVTAEEQPVSAAIELHTVTEKAGTYTAASADGRFTVPLDSLGGGSGEAASLSADEDGRLRIEGRARPPADRDGGTAAHRTHHHGGPGVGLVRGTPARPLRSPDRPGLRGTGPRGAGSAGRASARRR